MKYINTMQTVRTMATVCTVVTVGTVCTLVGLLLQVVGYSITTITGEQVVEKKVYELNLISVRGLERVTAVEGGLEGELYGGILPPDLASTYGVDSPEKSALEEPAVVLILGSDMSHLMPRVRAPPRQLKRQQPGLMLADSILSNRTLYFGPVKMTMSAPPMRQA